MAVTASGIEVEAVEYSQDSVTVRTQFDHEKTPASMAVIATLADVLDTDPAALEPLHSTVDTDALDALVRVRPESNGDTQVALSHEGYSITVHSHGVITITPEHERTAAYHGGGRDNDD
ncbi:hypothetical protein L593_04605 [Salinarchaeum sp. Harcht-Bsk1]|uniref:HalOD1 output domain-containing protein n=1 Tax=Salinarchaeum sp. Harcht-Bsk1 TaxID=1333523 RepID=UPI0003424879|nr:HalOD1 output domain-containing protein [Salinarchaeum sp. Harcht-Bsk1]AGN00870.1 hypothetical protein L593_04605 [Salinarchaeum sp. Harcht-Bsk1]